MLWGLPWQGLCGCRMGWGWPCCLARRCYGSTWCTARFTLFQDPNSLLHVGPAEKNLLLCKGHSSPPFRLGVGFLLGNVHRASWPKGLQLFRVLFSVQKSAKKLLGGVPTKSFLSLGCPARYPHGERPHCWWLCPRSSFPRVLAAAQFQSSDRKWEALRMEGPISSLGVLP